MTQPTLVVLAAGIGSRYGGFKQLDPVGPRGEMVLDYSLYDAWRAGFGKVVFVIRPELENDFRDHFGAAARHLDVRYVHQTIDRVPVRTAGLSYREKPWGTGHALWVTRDVVNEPFAVINADDFYGPSSYRLLRDFLTKKQSAEVGPPRFCTVAFHIVNTLSRHGSVARGVCEVDQDGLLCAVVERTRVEPNDAGGARYLKEDGTWFSVPGDTPVSMNMWGFTPALFPELEAQLEDFLAAHGTEPKTEFFLPSVVDNMIRSGRCVTSVLISREKWFGMTYRQDREEVAQAIRNRTAEGHYPETLWGDK